MKRIAAIAAALVMFAGVAHAETQLGRSMMGAADITAPTVKFPVDTATISLHMEILNTVDGDKVQAAWIAVKTNGAPPGYLIDTAEVTLKVGMREASFSLSKPTAGWPTGDYRVDVSINGAQAESVPFTVE